MVQLLGSEGDKWTYSTRALDCRTAKCWLLLKTEKEGSGRADGLVYTVFEAGGGKLWVVVGPAKDRGLQSLR